VKQHHVACRAGILHDLQRDAVMFFNLVHETVGAFVVIAFGVQVAKIGMTLKQAPTIGAACARWWRIVFEVLVNQPMRARNDQRSAGAVRNIPEQCMRSDASGRGKRAHIARVDMPAMSRHGPGVV
jgi:hypothetical protein